MLGGAIGQFALGQFKPPDANAVVSTTLGALTSAVTVKAIVSANVTRSLAPLSSSATAKAVVRASLSTTLAPLNSSVTARAIVSASFTSTLAPLSSTITTRVRPGPYYLHLGEQEPAPQKIFSRVKIVGRSVVQGFSKTKVHTEGHIVGTSVTDFITRTRISVRFELQTEPPSMPVVAYARIVDHGWVKRDRTIGRNNNIILLS